MLLWRLRQIKNCLTFYASPINFARSILTGWAIKIILYCFGVVESKTISLQSWKFKKIEKFWFWGPFAARGPCRGGSVLFEVEHMPKSTLGWVGGNLQKSKSTNGTFRAKNGVMGVFVQISKSTFSVFFLFFQLIFSNFNKFSRVISGHFVHFAQFFQF